VLALVAGAACGAISTGADDAVDAFMERITVGDEVGARAYWAWDYPMGDADDAALYSSLVRDLSRVSRAGPKVEYERHSMFYYRDAAFTQPVNRSRDAQVSQVDVTISVTMQGRTATQDPLAVVLARERLTLIMARVPGTPQEWRIFAVRTDPQVIQRFADPVATALRAETVAP
jgi:hypothetical protein